VEDLKRTNQQNPMVFMNAGGGGAAAASSSSNANGGGSAEFVGTKSKNTAAILALFLGGIGFHKFYLGQTLQGVLYLAFCWTGLPLLISFFEAISYLMMSQHQFKMKFG
jgi:TM2 domain-containing membrane protein YozV